jgi:hypothetical protein
MAYFIFLKYLRSLEEFRKNSYVKIPPKSPCANFQSLGIFKNQILFRKEFSPSLSAHLAFRPSRGPLSLFFSTDRFSLPFPLGLGLSAGPAHHHGPTSRRLLPPALKPNTAPPPACLVPPPRSPRCLHRTRETTACNSPSFPPINQRHSPPSSIPETGAFNPTIQAPSSRQLKALGPPLPRLRPIKADPALGEASHTSNAPSLSPFQAEASTAGEMLFHRLPSRGNPAIEFAGPPSLSLTPRSELSGTGMAGGRAPESGNGCRSTVDWAGAIHGLEDSVHEFSLGKQFPKNPILDILHLDPSVFPKLTRSP